MTYIALFLVLLLGTGGTVAASESAKPGDFLFPLDRATEQLRLSLASDEKRTTLEAAFIAERFAELEAILDEERIAASSTVATSTDDAFLQASSTAWLASTSIEFEADVFTDITIIKVEVAGKKAYFTTTATTSADIVVVIMDRYDIPETVVTSNLSIDIEDRASRPSDIGTTVTTHGEERIAAAIAVLAAELEAYGDDTSSQSDRLHDLLDEIESIVVEGRDDSRFSLDGTRVRIDDDRIELRTGDERIRIDEKDGELRIKYDDDDHDSGFSNDNDRDDDRGEDGRDDEDDDSGDNDDDQNGTSTRSTLEVEADVFTDITVVEVEQFGKKTMFTMQAASTEAEVAAEVAKRYGVTVVSVEAVLDYEVENRANRPQDKENKNDDDDSVRGNSDSDDDISVDISGGLRIGDDDSDDDKDKDKDEDDNSGHSGGNDDEDDN